AVEHVGHGLEAAVRMARKPGQVVLRAIGAELVEQQERIEIRQLGTADDARQLDPGPVGRGRAADRAGDAGVTDRIDGAHGPGPLWTGATMHRLRATITIINRTIDVKTRASFQHLTTTVSCRGPAAARCDGSADCARSPAGSWPG